MNRSRRRLLTAAGTCAATFSGLLALAPVAAATAPAPVSGLTADVSENTVVELHWTASPDTARAVACYDVDGSAPATPAAAQHCNAPTTGVDDTIDGAPDTSYAISVFALAADGTASAPATATATTTHAPPMRAAELRTTALDAHALTLRWSGDTSDGDVDPAGTTGWVVTMAAGTVPPAEDAAAVAELPADRTAYVVRDLPADVAYTFSVRGRGTAGELSSPSSVTAATRIAGVVGRSRLGGAAAVVPATAGRDLAVAADVAPDGRQRVVYARGSRVEFSGRAAGRPWAAPVVVARDTRATAPLIAVGRGGAVAVGWNSDGHVVVRRRPAGSDRWSPAHRFAGTEVLRGLAVDSRGGLHLLTSTAERGELRYRTDAGGRWSVTAVADSASEFGRAALTIDRRTDRVVVVDAHETGAEHADADAVYRTVQVRVATAARSATALGTWRVRLERNPAGTPAADVVAVSPVVASSGGRVSVAVGLAPAFGGEPTAADGVFVVREGRLLRVAGSSTTATAPVLAAPTPDRLVVAWSERDLQWRPAAQGVRLAAQRLVDGSWTAPSAHVVTGSRYDHALAATRDARGRYATVVATSAGDVR